MGDCWIIISEYTGGDNTDLHSHREKVGLFTQGQTGWVRRHMWKFCFDCFASSKSKRRGTPLSLKSEM
jgi:hypothetical protein